MKKFIFTTLFLISVQFIFSQVLKGKWVIPTVELGNTHMSWELSFMDNEIIYDTLPTSLPGTEEFCEMASGGYLSNYSLRFYILGKYFCYGNENFIWNFVGTQTIAEFDPEFQIINRPGFIDRYYTFYTGADYDKEIADIFTYNEIWFENNEWNVSEHHSIIAGFDKYGYTAFGFTDEVDGFRRLYASIRNNGFIEAGIRKWLVNDQGVNLNSIETIIDATDPNFIAQDFNAYNLEIKTLLNGEDVIAWISASDISNDKVFIFRNDNGYIYDLNKGRIGGIEFSDYNSDYLYVSCTNDGLVVINYLTGQIVQDLNPGSVDYGRTFLQKSPDGHIYGVSNTGRRLGRINQTTGQFQPDVFEFPSPLGDNIVSTYRVFNNQKYFILPEDNRVYHPLTVLIDPNPVSCPGANDGSAEVTVSGGQPDFTYQWYVWNGTSFIEMTGYTSPTADNLAVGLYQCCVIDSNEDYECSEIEIIVDPYLFTHPGGFWTLNNTQSINNSNFSFETGIKIINNSTVTLNNCYFQFGKDAKVIIEQGSKLVMNNTTFTSLQACPNMWQGVEVWGNKLMSQYQQNGQYWQGTLILNSYSIIENAKTAVALWKPNDWNSMGGIVTATNSTFRNNARSVHAYWYNNFNPYTGAIMDNVSYFKNCTFEINSSYMADFTFYKHVDLDKVKGIRFMGTDFSLSGTNGISQWNQAIASYNSGFSVTALCNSPTIPCNDFDECTFNGFFWGIYATNTGINTNTFTVKNAIFTNNSTGISINSVNKASVLFSEFYIGYNAADQEECDGKGSGFGIHMTGCTGFAIEENYFTKASGAPEGNYTGILCKESKSFHDIIYRNTFTGLSYGNFAEGDNRHSSDDQFGLEYQCNFNTGNNRDFIVTGNDPNSPPQIRGYQGSMIREAGNTFSTGVQLPDGHFKNTGTQVINYCYNTNPPVYYTDYYVMPIPNAGANTCPSNYGGGSGGSTRGVVLTEDEKQEAELAFANNLSDFNNVKALYNNLKDGGNTQALKTEVETAWPSDMWELRAELLGKSPHLSKEVLMAAADKTDVLPESILFEILSANPDELRKEELISHLENKDQPLPAYMISILRQLAGGVTYKTILQQDMARYFAGKTQAAYMLIRSCLNDTVSDYDYLRTWLNNLDNLNADMQIVAAYLAEENYTAAQAMLNLIPATRNLEGNALADYNDYKTMMEMQMAWQQQNRSIFELDSLEVAILVDFAENTSGKAALMARGILEYAYGYHFCNCLPVDDPAAWKSTAMMPGSDVDNGLSIQAVPNPASTWVAFNFTLPVHVNEAVLQITDVHGRSITSFVITAKQGQQVWDIRDMKKGVYLYTLKAGTMSKNGKLIIN